LKPHALAIGSGELSIARGEQQHEQTTDARIEGHERSDLLRKPDVVQDNKEATACNPSLHCRQKATVAVHVYGHFLGQRLHDFISSPLTSDGQPEHAV